MSDKVRVTTYVAVDPATAFAVFTEEIDRWWRRGPAYRVVGRAPSAMYLEPRPDGRIFEQPGEAGAPLHDVGRITIWEPPAHLVFTWRSVTFAPGESTTVELWFEARGEGTRVILEHRGWDAIRGDHPVRHGRVAPAFIRELGMWWAGLLTSFGERAAGGDDAG